MRRIEFLARAHEKGKPEALKPTAYTSFQEGYRKATEDAASTAELSAWKSLAFRIRKQGETEVKI